MRLGLSGHGGVVDIDHCARIGYLRDASEHCLPGSNFEVPFSIDSLSIVAEFCREASSPLSESQERRASHGSSFAVVAPHVQDKLIHRVSLDLLFEVVRAADFLQCDDLLWTASCAAASRFSKLSTDPDALTEVLVVHADDGPGLWSAAWTGLVNEPILHPPIANHDFTDDHPLGNDNVLELFLLQCDVATLRMMKGTSSHWCQRARLMLNDKRWQEAQISIDLSWALGVECMELTQKRWACACALCFAMPKLESISVLNTLINLNHLVRTVTHLDARALSHGTTVVNDDQQQSVVYKRSRTDSPRGEARSPEAGNGHSHSLTRVKSHAAKVRVAAQIIASCHVVRHSSLLMTVDLSGLLPSMGGSWPREALKMLGLAVRTGAKSLEGVVIREIVIPVSKLRPPSDSIVDYPDIAAVQGSLDFTPRSGMSSDQGMHPDDITFFCGASDYLAHVVELDMSGNSFGDSGLETLASELMPVAGRLLANVRWLGLNDCGISDQGAISFASILESGAFCQLEFLSFVGNSIGDDGISAVAVTAQRTGTLRLLRHLNFGSNEIADNGCSMLTHALAHGALPSLVHLSLAMNNIGDEGIEAFASDAAAPTFVARLQYLGLGANQIGNRGITALACALACSLGFTELTGLWIADNPDIGDAGVVALADGLVHSRRVITDLYLQGVGMDAVGCDAMISALPVLKDIRHCVLGRVSDAASNRLSYLQRTMRTTNSRDDIVLVSWPHGPRPAKAKGKTTRQRCLPRSTLRWQ